MATKKSAGRKSASTPNEAPAPNREQRRREKFGRAGGATTEPWPKSEANPAFGRDGAVDDADAGRGVATEGGERVDPESVPESDARKS